MSFWERQPCLVAFCAEMALPSGVRGPVERERWRRIGGVEVARVVALGRELIGVF